VQFLVESAMLAGFGGLIGLFARRRVHDAGWPLRAGAGGGSAMGARRGHRMSTLVGVFFGIYPAKPRRPARPHRRVASRLIIGHWSFVLCHWHLFVVILPSPMAIN